MKRLRMPSKRSLLVAAVPVAIAGIIACGSQALFHFPDRFVAPLLLLLNGIFWAITQHYFPTSPAPKDE